MGFLLFAIVIGIVSELLWFKFYRDGKKQFKKYDKEHSNVAVLNAEEVVSKLNKSSSLGVSNIKSETNQVDFICKNNSYTISIENGTAYVEYDMSGCEVRLSFIGKFTKRFWFWKSAHKAMLINTVMDTLKNDCPTEQKEYQKTKIFAKAAVVAFASFLIFLVIGCFSLIGSVSNEAVSDAQTMEYCDGITYEEVINSYLKNAEWTTFNSETDTAVVEVNGTSVEGEKICIQFWGNMGMGLSYKSLTIKYFDVDGVPLEPEAAMEYIYLNYYLNQ